MSGRRVPGGAAHQRTQPHHQFLDPERLGEIVVGACLEAVDLVGPAVARGQDQHGQVAAVLAPRAQHLRAGHFRQAEIEHGGIVGLGVAEMLAVLAIRPRRRPRSSPRATRRRSRARADHRLRPAGFSLRCPGLRRDRARPPSLTQAEPFGSGWIGARLVACGHRNAPKEMPDDRTRPQRGCHPAGTNLPPAAVTKCPDRWRGDHPARGGRRDRCRRHPARATLAAPECDADAAGSRQRPARGECSRRKGNVAEIFGNKFILQDDSGRALVDLGPRGEYGNPVTRGETVTVQGRFERGVIRAQVVAHADGRSDAFGPPDRGPGGPEPKAKGKKGAERGPPPPPPFAERGPPPPPAADAGVPPPPPPPPAADPGAPPPPPPPAR